MIDFLAARMAELYMVLAGYLPASRLDWGLIIVTLMLAAAFSIVWIRWTLRRRVEQAFGRGFVTGVTEKQVVREVGGARLTAFFAGMALVIIIVFVLAVFVF